MFGAYISVQFETWVAISIALLIAIALIVVYILRRDLFIEVHPDGGPPISLRFKPSVIEGVPIDVNKALAAIGVIRDLRLMEASSLQTMMDPDGEKRRQYTEQLRHNAEAQLAEEARSHEKQEAEERARREAAIQRRKEQQEAAERRRKEAAEQKRLAEIERQREEERLANASTTVNCPSCKRKLTITDLRTGSEYVCPHCKRAFTMS
jgi:membrane protein involved in colicin uptake